MILIIFQDLPTEFNETLEFADKAINKDKVAIIKVTIPPNVYDKLNHMYLDVSIFKSGTPVVEPDMLNFFNDNIISIDHFFRRYKKCSHSRMWKLYFILLVI